MIRGLLALLGWPAWLGSVIVLGLGVAGVGGAYLKGRFDANANCRAAELAAQLEILKRDLAVAKVADEAEARLRQEIEAENARLEQEVADYEKSLAERPADQRCALSDDDVKRLSKP